MATFVFRCPVTGFNVQGWSADDAPTDDGEFYETVMCLACTRTHLVNRSTGRVLGSEDK